MNKYEVSFKHVNNSPLNIPDSKNFDCNNFHTEIVEAGTPRAAEKKLVQMQKDFFNREVQIRHPIKIIRTVEEK